MSRASDFPAIPQPSGNQTAFNAAVKQILETYQGNVGNANGLDRVVRFKDLVSLDPIKFNSVMRTSATSRITRITGNIIRTGKIESNDSSTYFDLDNDKLVFNGKTSYDSSMPGMFQGKDGGTYKANWGYDETNYFKFSGTKILAKADNFELDEDGKISATDATLSGTITASAGAIGGWIITDNGIADNATEDDAEIFLDKINSKIRVGPTTGYVDIDGPNVRVRSSNYASGAMGSGFSLSPDLFEVGNIAARGIFRTSVFQKGTVSSVGGSVLISTGADVLATDMTSLDASTLEIEGNETFAVGDFLLIQEDNDSEWFEVTDISSAPIYTVTRDKKDLYGADSNPAWTKGAAVTNFGASGAGVIYMTASETHAPYISLATHAGEPWNALQIRSRWGNLNGSFGYTTDLYGQAMGDDDGYSKYDTTNGMRIRGAISGSSITGGIITGAEIQTSATGKRVLINADGIQLITGSVTGKYGNFKYGDGTKYGSGLLASFYNTTTGMPFYVHSEQIIADMHLYNRSADPTGAAEVLDIAGVGGTLKICTAAGTPGTFRGLAFNGINTDITSMTGLDDDGIPVAKVANGDIATDTIWDAPGDTVYGTGANTAAKLAAGAGNLKLFMNAAGTAPEWARGMKIGTFTHDISVTGTQEVSGLGFKPSYVIFISTVAGSARFSVGFDNGTNAYAIFDYHGTSADAWNQTSSYSIGYIWTDASNYADALITTLGADGFTVTWAKNGSPTGTAQVHYIAFR